MFKRTHKRLVTCESDLCSPRGEVPQQHLVTADCVHPRTWCCAGTHVNQDDRQGAARRGHHVEVVGDDRSAHGCHAECSCGWISGIWAGKGSHAQATAAKWGHVDAISGVR